MKHLFHMLTVINFYDNAMNASSILDVNLLYSSIIMMAITLYIIKHMRVRI